MHVSMQRIVLVLGLSTVLVGCGDESTTATPDTPVVRTVAVVEHVVNEILTDHPPTGDSSGDVLTFANQLYDKDNKKQVGTDQGYCLRVDVGKSFRMHVDGLPRGRPDHGGRSVLRREGVDPRDHRRHRRVQGCPWRDGARVPGYSDGDRRIRLRLQRADRRLIRPHRAASFPAEGADAGPSAVCGAVLPDNELQLVTWHHQQGHEPCGS